jgi:hypothetical protein
VGDVLELALLGAPLHPGPTGSLSLSLHHRWEPERPFVLITTYLDESGTHGSSTLMTMGGYVGKLAHPAESAQ